MIPEPVLEQLLAEIARGIPVPAGGAQRVVDHVGATVGPARRPSPGVTRLLLVAAVLVVIGGLALLMHGNGTGSSSSHVAAAARPSTSPLQEGAAPTPLGNHGAKGAQGPIGVAGGTGAAGSVGDRFGAVGVTGPQGLGGNVGPQGGPGFPGVQGDQGIVGADAPQGATGPASPAGGVPVTTPPSHSTAATVPAQSPTEPIDGALIVKTGSLDLQVPHDALRPTFNRITTTVVGLGGYVSNQTASYNGADPTGIMNVRVPVNLFEKAVSQINGLPGVKVLGDSETGKDVTAQYVNVQAQITALTTEEQSLLGLLAKAQDLNDILNLRGQVTGVQSQIDQLQGSINLLRNEASFSALAIAATEVVPPAVKKAQAAAHHTSTRGGLSRSWAKATHGFSTSVEWFIARSGASIILLLAALAFVFGLRYLYPVLRRALM